MRVSNKGTEKLSWVSPSEQSHMNDSQSLSGEQLSALVTAVAQSRDRGAFAQLFDYFAPRLKAFMMKKGADPAPRKTWSRTR